jgi:hypothetical protein
VTLILEICENRCGKGLLVSVTENVVSDWSELTSNS